MTSRYDPEFDRAVMAAPVLIDNPSDRLWGSSGEYDGPRCADENCDTAVDDDGEMCAPCADSPHEFVQGGDPRWPDFCACGRIRSIGGYSPVHTDDESGGAA